jgi:hypothetical protein
VYALILKLEKFLGEFGGGEVAGLGSIVALADLVVLAKYASQVTVGKKYCAGTVLARDGWLFAGVNTYMSNGYAGICATASKLALCAIYAAFPGAKLAIG